MTDIGFLGLGIMGAPMAGHLLDGGHNVATAVHKTQPSKELTDKGLKVLDSPKAVAEASEVIILIVPDTPEVEEVLFGENGVAAGLSLVALALGTLLVRVAAGAVYVQGALAANTHHLLEHGLDIVMAALVIAAVYTARAARREHPEVVDDD
jgi:3-hydroxyisobutyrate dehydrogenase-like beta-hydroxyacid dehydrogenase